MKKSYEIVVEYLYPQKEKDPFKLYQEVSDPLEKFPGEKEVLNYVKFVNKKETHEINGISYSPIIQKAWVREVYTEFKNL